MGIATHDERLVGAAMSLVDRLGLPLATYEFQMLLGVDLELRRIIIAAGHRLRVYTPFGVDWYRYSMRRLRENPTVARHVLAGMLRRRPALELGPPLPRLLPSVARILPDDQYRSDR